MQAALKLNSYKLKNEIINLIATLCGIILLQVVSILVKKDTFYVDFEDTRTVTFLLLFSTSLLILVKYSTTISGEWDILRRDFFSGLRRRSYWAITSLFQIGLATIETAFFLLGFQLNLLIFDIPSPKHLNFWELGLVVLLTYSATHLIALCISLLTVGNSTLAVICAATYSVLQFSLAGTLMPLPREIKQIDLFVLLSPAHKAFGLIGKITTLPSVVAAYGVPIPNDQLNMFQARYQPLAHDLFLLGLQLAIYFVLFGVILHYKVPRHKG